jgi:hypothetical protein
MPRRVDLMHVKPQDWERRERDELRETTTVGRIILIVLVCILGGFVWCFLGVFLFVHFWPTYSVSRLSAGGLYFTGGAAFVWGVFSSLRIVLGAIRHQREFDRLYGPKRK